LLFVAINVREKARAMLMLHINLHIDTDCRRFIRSNDEDARFLCHCSFPDGKLVFSFIRVYLVLTLPKDTIWRALLTNHTLFEFLEVAGNCWSLFVLHKIIGLLIIGFHLINAQQTDNFAQFFLQACDRRWMRKGSQINSTEAKNVR